MDNTQLIANGLALVVKAYRAKHTKFIFDKDTSAIYLRLLSDLPGEAVIAACLDHVSKSPWFPGIDEIRKRTTDILANSKEQLTPYEAWAEVLRIFRGIGGRKSENPLVEKTVQSMGGWRVLGMSENQVADRARFVESYSMFVERERDSATTLPIVRELSDAILNPNQLESGVNVKIRSLAANLSS